jgi:uncharacterized membrane protein YfcA
MYKINEKTEKQRKRLALKLKIYKYMLIVFAVGAVVCFVLGPIISNKFLPFVGIMLIAVGVIPLIEPLVKEL